MRQFTELHFWTSSPSLTKSAATSRGTFSRLGAAIFILSTAFTSGRKTQRRFDWGSSAKVRITVPLDENCKSFR